jgi:GT2 family glycosyltransferase
MSTPSGDGGAAPQNPPPARSPKDPPRVLALVLAWNGRSLTEACLDSVLQMDYPRFDVVVVDNASTDDTVSVLRQRYAARVELIANDTNLLFAGGMNVGLRRALAAGYDAVLLLNNDVVVDSGMLQALVDTIGRDPRIAAAGPKIYFYEPRDRIWFAGGELSLWRGWSRHRGLRQVDRGQHDVERDVDYLTGCCFLVRREALEDVGLFDTGFAMYAEDADWSFRARERGWRLVYAPAARMWHRVSASAGTRSWFKMRRRVMSQVRFLRRHARWYHAISIPFGTLVEAARITGLLVRRRV